MNIRKWLSALMLAASVVFVTGAACRSDETPDKAFSEWTAAVAAGNLARANELTAKGNPMGQLLNAFLVEGVKSNPQIAAALRRTEVISFTIDGDRAKVKFKNADGDIKFFDMVREDGRWKIDPKE